MPKIRRTNVPEALLRHLIERVREREVSSDSIGALSAWLDTNPEVPQGEWFHRLQEVTICGKGEMVVTILKARQIAIGEEV